MMVSLKIVHNKSELASSSSFSLSGIRVKRPKLPLIYYLSPAWTPKVRKTVYRKGVSPLWPSLRALCRNKGLWERQSNYDFFFLVKFSRGKERRRQNPEGRAWQVTANLCEGGGSLGSEMMELAKDKRLQGQTREPPGTSIRPSYI